MGHATATAHALIEEAAGPQQPIGGRYRLTSMVRAGPRGAEFIATNLAGTAFALGLTYDEGDRSGEVVRQLAEMQHPHLQTPIDSGHDAERHVYYLVKKPSFGETVEQLVQRLGALEPSVAVRIVLQASRALMAAHRVGIYHGALTPAALTLEPEVDELLVRVGHFALGGHDGPNPYQAPEADSGPSQQGDVFALGAILRELCEGPSSDTAATLVQQRAPWLEPALALALDRATDPLVERRWPSVEAFAATLQDFTEGNTALCPGDLLAVKDTTRGRTTVRTEVGKPAPESPPESTPADGESLLGRHLDGRYRVERLIGRGGMGAVYEVVDLEGKRWAAKLISRSAKNESSLRRFAREARSAIGINSAHVANTVESGIDEALGMPFIIMELLEGVDLGQHPARQLALSPEVAVRLILQAARGIRAAHAQGVIHRDIKPANLFLQRDPTGRITVKVCDFGVAKRTQVELLETSTMNLTRTGRMLGSPLYMSPEQARSAKHVDERTDIWSLSIVLWELLSGQRLWGTKPSLGTLIQAICADPIPRIDRAAPWVGLGLAQVVHRGLERNLDRRFQSIDEMIVALTPFARDDFVLHESDLVAIDGARRARTSASALELVEGEVPVSIELASNHSSAPRRTLWPVLVGLLLIACLGLLLAYTSF